MISAELRHTDHYSEAEKMVFISTFEEIAYTMNQRLLYYLHPRQSFDLADLSFLAEALDEARLTIYEFTPEQLAEFDELEKELKQKLKADSQPMLRKGETL